MPRYLPGDRPSGAYLEQVIRVDQAGEYGAKRIYEGQLAALHRKKRAELAETITTIQHMADQEQEHLDYFNKEMVKRKVRPSLLSPLWHVGGYALGYLTAKAGTKNAMACTAAVETVIDRHYESQLQRLGEDEAALKQTIRKFQAEEMEHHDTSIAHHARQAPAFPLVNTAIQAITRSAVELAKRV